MMVLDPARLAQTYAAKGIPVFPITISWDPEKQKTNKRPLTTNGFRDATTDPDTITRMFDRQVNSGAVLAVGLHPGPAGYVIIDLDIDERVDGLACWQDLCQLYGNPGDVPTVLTASGGRHLWFRKPDGVDYGNAHDLGEGIDVRADDGYVVAPGTTTPWGSWEWDGDDIHTLPSPTVPPWTGQRLHTSAGSGAPAERNVNLDRIEDPADRAAIEALIVLGGHGLHQKTTTRPNGTAVTCYYLTRPGKIAGTSVSVGYIAPGVARVFTPNWPGLTERAYDADELHVMAGLTPPPEAVTEAVAGNDADDSERTGSTWGPVDLATVVGVAPPQPKYLTRPDGQAFFYPARDHVLFGASESGKSWIAFLTAAQALENPDERVLIIDFEDDARSVLERFTSMGVAHDTLLNQDRFRYANPHEPVNDPQGRHTPASLDLGDLVNWAPTLVIIDGVTEGMTLERLNTLDGGDVATWYGILSRRFRTAGACVVMIDHTAKGLSDGQPTEFGSQHKRSGISGASFFVDPVQRPGRSMDGQPVEGLLRLRLTKDRGGWLRGRFRGELPTVADIDVTSYPDGGVTCHINPPDSGPGGTTDRLLDDIIEYLYLHDARPGGGRQSKSAIAEGVGRNRTDNGVGTRLMGLLKAKHVSVEKGARNSRNYALTTAGEAFYSEVIQAAETAVGEAP